MTADQARALFDKAQLIVWLQERHDNAQRLGIESKISDRRGWEEDAEYFRAAIEAIERSVDLEAELGKATAEYLVKAQHYGTRIAKLEEVCRQISEGLNGAVDNHGYWTEKELISHLFHLQEIAESARKAGDEASATAD